MAKTDEDEDEDLEQTTGKSSKKKLLIIIAAVVVLLIAAAVAGYFLLTGSDSETQTGDAAAQAEQQAAEQAPPQYYSMDPPFVVNLPGNPSLLQVGISLRVSGDAMVEFLKHNDPVFRDSLLNLLQGKDAATLKTRDAKETLQREMLETINRIVKQLEGPGEVQALYYTSFVMQ